MVVVIFNLGRYLNDIIFNNLICSALLLSNQSSRYVSINNFHFITCQDALRLEAHKSRASFSIPRRLLRSDAHFLLT